MFPKRVTSSVVGIGGKAGAIGRVLFPLYIGYVLEFYRNAGNIVAGYNIIFIVGGNSFLVTKMERVQL